MGTLFKVDIFMNKLLQLLLRIFIIKPFRLIVGDKSIKKMMLNIIALFGYDPLIVVYNERGIFKWQEDESGELFVLQLLQQHFKNKNINNPILIDVGANKGIYSARLRGLFADARIIAMEPNPYTFSELRETARGKEIDIHNFGLGVKNERLRMTNYNKDISSMHGTLYKDVFKDFYKENDLKEFDVEIKTLNDFCDTQGIRQIDFIKIDTEGNDFFVLKGGNTILSNISFIQFEFNELNIFSRIFLRDYYNLLPNFNFYRLDSKRLIPLLSYDSFNEIFKFQNILSINKQVSDFNSTIRH
jgi:FkbM family methyltransferase